MNFKTETEEILKEHGKTLGDIDFAMIQYRVFGKIEKTIETKLIDKQEFLDNIDFEYDDGFRTEQIHLGLKVVGKDWWIERREYNGLEWWEWKELPRKPIKKIENSIEWKR